MEYQNHISKHILVELVASFTELENEVVQIGFHESVDGNPYSKLFQLFVRFCAVYRENPIDNIGSPEEMFPLHGDKAQKFSSMFTCFEGLRKYISEHQKVEDFETAIESESLKLGFGQYYEFTDEELERAQELINDLRTHFTDAKSISEQHKRRIFDKLEKLQRELHKRISDFDFYMGRLIGVGQALGGFGKEIKPLTDRYREVVRDSFNIINRANAGQQLLSSDEVCKLESQDENDTELKTA